MPQRKEDYMSTRNPGGNRRGGTDAMPNDPFAYLKLGANHGYLGHFRQDRFLEEGHNVSSVGQARKAVRKLKASGASDAAVAAGREVVAQRKSERKTAFQAVRSARSALAKANEGKAGGGVRKAAQAAVKAATTEAKSKFATAYQRQLAPKPKEESGGLFSKIKEAFTHPAKTVKKVGKKVIDVHKKGAKQFVKAHKKMVGK